METLRETIGFGLFFHVSSSSRRRRIGEKFVGKRTTKSIIFVVVLLVSLSLFSIGAVYYTAAAAIR